MIKKCKMSSHFKLFNGQLVVDVNIIFPPPQIVCTVYFFLVADNFWFLMPDAQSCPGPAFDQVSDQESRLSSWILSCARIEIFLAKTRFQLLVTLLAHDVQNNLADHWMHLKGPLISQINP